jgi:probable rRNA maturation factor
VRLLRDLERLGRLAAARAGRPVVLSFAALSDAGMARLHAQSLGIDGPTDVLAYPMADEGGIGGEVALGVDVARREAAARGHSAYHELLLYAVHGVLHLLGHDDHGAANRRRMRRAEREMLAALGAPAVYDARHVRHPGGSGRERRRGAAGDRRPDRREATARRRGARR